MRKRDHKAIKITNENLGIVAMVDEDIVPLIKEMWEANIITGSSCQNINNSGNIHLGMSADNAFKWINTITKFESGGLSLYNRITHTGCRGVVCWKYEIHPGDSNYDWNNDKVFDKSNVGFGVSIQFPRTDLNRVVELMKEHNEQAKQLSAN